MKNENTVFIENILSVFDGMSCGQIALGRAGIGYKNYFASEIDKYAIQIAKKNYPNTIHLGDVNNWKSWNLPKIDLFIGGSPCQGFSNAGKGLNFKDPRSRLFFVYVAILKSLRKKNPNLLFLLENVRMKQEWQDIISKQLGVKPIKINSALVSAQNRVRLYWTNIEGIEQPEDKYIYLKDILENNVDKKYFGGYNINYKSQSNSLHNVSGKSKTIHAGTHGYSLGYIPTCQGTAIKNQVTKRGVEEQLNIRKDGKSNCVVPSYPHKLNGVVEIKTIGHGYIKESVDETNKYPSLCAQSPESKHLIRVADIHPSRGISGRIYSSSGKSPTLMTMNTGGNQQPKILIDKKHYRKLTPLECERLQTLSDNYTEGVSNTQRYKMIGNGWTVDVIAHIFRHIAKPVNT